MRKSMSEAWIETYTGKRFPLLEPDEALLCIEDIAHALSNQCRWTGHTKFFYSVAEHSVLVSRYSNPIDQLEGLLHDASEASMADLNRPLKHCTQIGPPYFEVEKRIMQAVVNKFGLSSAMPASVKEADNFILWAEKQQLMPPTDWRNPGDWDVQPPNPKFSIPKIGGYFPRAAENLFLDTFEQLTKNLKAIN